jgi:hypothetical protein
LSRLADPTTPWTWGFRFTGTVLRPHSARSGALHFFRFSRPESAAEPRRLPGHTNQEAAAIGRMRAVRRSAVAAFGSGQSGHGQFGYGQFGYGWKRNGATSTSLIPCISLAIDTQRAALSTPDAKRPSPFMAKGRWRANAAPFAPGVLVQPMCPILRDMTHLTRSPLWLAFHRPWCLRERPVIRRVSEPRAGAGDQRSTEMEGNLLSYQPVKEVRKGDRHEIRNAAGKGSLHPARGK